MKKLLIAAGIMILSGALISGAAYIAGAGRNHEKPVYKTEEISVKNIKLVADNTDITVINGNSFSVTYPFCDKTNFSGQYENDTYIAEYSAENNTILGLDLHLSLELDATHQNVITVSIPNDFDGNIEVSTNTGDITVTDIDAKTLKSQTDYGDIYIAETNADVETNTDTGDTELHSLHGNISAVSDTGDTSAENVNGDTIRIESRIGDIYLLADGAENDYSINGVGDGQKTIYTDTDMGDTEITFTGSMTE